MSVYTPVTPAQLSCFLNHYGIYDLQSFSGIENGVENSNYLVTTGHGKFVLTLFEELKRSQIPPYLALVSELHSDDIPSVPALSDLKGNTLNTLAKKPASLFPFIPGESPQDATVSQLQALGENLGRIHCSPAAKHNHFDFIPHDQAITDATPLRARLDEAEQGLFTQAMETVQKLNRTELPQGIIHGDLFRDNTLFQNNELVGILDFYSASRDALLLDLAICVTDWCRNKANELSKNKMVTLLDAYETIRPLQAIETKLWPSILVFAALRFWCSRLVYKERHPNQLNGQQKDPVEYRDLLRFILENIAAQSQTN